MKLKTRVYYNAQENELIIHPEGLFDFLEMERAFNGRNREKDKLSDLIKASKCDNIYKINLDGINNKKG